MFACAMGIAQNDSLTEEELDEAPYYRDLGDALKEPEVVYKLALRHQELSKFPKKILKLKELRVLLLDSNEISEIPEEIGELKKLQRLDLSSNKLAAIPEALAGLPELRALYLSDNKISTIPTKFYLLRQLRALSLDRNQLTEFPPQMSGFEHLYYLDISYNNIVTLPREIGSFSRMRILALNGNKLAQLPREFFLLQDLKYLYAGNNSLTELPVGFEKLGSLQLLAVHNNKITSISNLMNITSLRRLYVEGNKLDSIPHTIGQLFNLRDLDIGGNPLITLPDELSKLHSLEQLDISGIKFPEFPEVLYDLLNNEVEISGFEKKEIYKVKLLLSQGRNRQLIGNYDEAIAKFKELLTLDKGNCMAMYEIASCYRQMKRYDSCMSVCNDVARRFPDQKINARMKVLEYNCLHEMKQDERADSLFKSTAPKYPTFSQLLFVFGKKYFEQKSYDTAMYNFMAAVRADSLNENAHFYLGITAHALDKDIPSIFATLRFLTLEQEDSRARSILPFLMTRMGMRTGTTTVGRKGKVSTSYTDNYVIRDENGRAIYRSGNPTADLLAAMMTDISNSIIDTLLKKSNNVELFMKKCKEICSDTCTELKAEAPFFTKYYARYFREMIAQGYLETFAYIITAQRSREQYITDWTAKNEEKIDAFYTWSEGYRWNRP